MKKKLIVFITCLVAMFELLAQQTMYVSTNRTHYVVGDQVLFDVSRFDEDRVLLTEDNEAVVEMDLVAPDGLIVQTKSLIRSQNGCYFFSLADSLGTGIYRLVANSAGAFQAVKRIHVFALELEEPMTQQAAQVIFRVHGGVLARQAINKVAIRVLDDQGRGMKSKGTLVNGADSVLQYLDTDVNGVTSFEVDAKDSIYQIKFGQQVIDLKTEHQLINAQVKQTATGFQWKISNLSDADDQITISVDDETVGTYEVAAGQETNVALSTGGMVYGLHQMKLKSNIAKERSFLYLLRPASTKDFAIQPITLGNNEQSEFAIEDSHDQIGQLRVSVIDKNKATPIDFYEEYFFDQSELDLQLVRNRDFDAYLMLFADRMNRRVNESRLAAKKRGGVLYYKSAFPFDEISMLNLKTMKALDVRSESIKGVYDFESAVGTRSRVFPYHFTTYLQPIDLAEFKEAVVHSYPALNTVIHASEEDRNLVRSYELQKNILLSYQDQAKKEFKLPDADYTYDLENYDIPNTMIDMINYIIKYVSVEKNGKGEVALSMFRHMSTYKYRGSPLLFLNNLPVYDARTIVNLNPKDFASVEVRNSYKSNGHLGNFSLNGSVSFFLKDGVENPLEKAYAELPVLESCKNFNLKAVAEENAPDFRHQLYWNPSISKTNDSFWVDLKSSDLSTTYDVQITAFMKDGSVIQKQSELIVK